jgi:hypothetical protein
MMPKPVAAAASRLADVLDRENDALRAMDLPRAGALLAEKTAAIADLTAAGEAAVIEPPSAALVTAARRLDGLVAENRRLLERAMEAQRRVIGIVVRAAAASAPPRPAYGATGRMGGSTRPMALSTRA